MRGVRKGVATLVQQMNKKCITAHCAAHRLQLVAEDTFETVTSFHDVVDDVFTRIYGHFCRSSQRTNEFAAFQREFNDDESTSSVRHFCRTRWLSRGHVVQTTTEQLPALLSMFKEQLRSRPSSSARAAAAPADPVAAAAPALPVVADAAPAAAVDIVEEPAAPVIAPAATLHAPPKRTSQKRSRVDQLQDKLSASFTPSSAKRRHVPSSRAREGSEQEKVLEQEVDMPCVSSSSSSLSSSSSSSSSSSPSSSSSSSFSSSSSMSSSSTHVTTTATALAASSAKAVKLDPLQALFDDARSIEFLGLLAAGADILPYINILSCEFQKHDLFAYDVYSRVDDCITQLQETQLDRSTRLFTRVEKALDAQRTPRVEGTTVEIEFTEDRMDIVRIDANALPGALAVALQDRFPCGDLMAATKIFVPTAHPSTGLSKFGWEEVDTICKHFEGIIDADATRREYPVIRARLSGELGGMSVFAAWERLLSDESFASRYPNMCTLASLFLIVMPTSVDCERAFSIMSLIKTKLRNQLEIESTDALMRITMNGPCMSDCSAVNALIHDSHRAFQKAKQRRRR